MNIPRRNFITTTGGVILGNTLLDTHTAKAQVQSNKPNILVILVDDLGFGDLSCYGGRYLYTPHLDRLAEEGMRFTNAYANCPVCSPTRAALLSGRYQEFVGVPGVIRTHENNSWGYLLPEAKLLPKFMKDAGYNTAMVGKWHLGLESPNTPNERGFDYFHGFLGDMMDDYYTHRRHNINYMRLNDTQIDPKGHASDLFTQWTCEYLLSYKEEKPFFLYLAYNAPHTPIQPPEDWVKRYKERHPDASEKQAKMAALIEHMDDGIGQVLNTLDETGLADNTLVIFASDNGGREDLGANNGPYRSGKGTMYEGGIRVPMIARWPGHTPAGSETTRIAMSMDIMPTIVQATGAGVDTQHEGVSFLDTLQGTYQPTIERDLFWGRKEGGGFFQGGRIEAIRRGDWKLLRSKPKGPYELYDLANDPMESSNMADQNHEKREELAAALEAQLERYAKVPWQKN